MKYYIGLDAHSTTCTFVCLGKNGIEVQKHHTPTSERNIQNFLLSLKGEKHLVFEESGMSIWLHTIIRGHVDEL